jgi:cathepsin X
MTVTQEFEDYDPNDYAGGIFVDNDGKPLGGHEIALVGFGHDDEQDMDYWIGRNSWGTYWGDNGFFRIRMGHDDLSIEEQCDWGVPYLDKKMKIVSE